MHRWTLVCTESEIWKQWPVFSILFCIYFSSCRPLWLNSELWLLEAQILCLLIILPPKSGGFSKPKWAPQVYGYLRINLQGSMPSIRDLITWGEGSEKMGTGQEHGAEPRVTNSIILGSTFGLHLSMVFLCTQTTYFLIPYRTEISSLIIFGQLKTKKHIHILRYVLRWKTGRLLSPHFPGYLVFHFYNNHKVRQPCRS